MNESDCESAAATEKDSTSSSSPGKESSVKWCFRTNRWRAAVAVAGETVAERLLKPADVALEEVSEVVEGISTLENLKCAQIKALAFEVLKQWAEQQ